MTKSTYNIFVWLGRRDFGARSFYSPLGVTKHKTSVVIPLPAKLGEVWGDRAPQLTFTLDEVIYRRASSMMTKNV